MKTSFNATLCLTILAQLCVAVRATNTAALNDTRPVDSCRDVPVIPTGWFHGRERGPPTLHTMAQLHALGKYVAPVLYGGLGNQLFQLAALHVYARSVK